MKKSAIFIFIFIMSAVLILFSSCYTPGDTAGSDNHGDSADNGNGAEDPSTPETPEDNDHLELISGGVAKFNIVFSSDADSDTVAAVLSIVKELATRGISVNYGSDKYIETTECEILIGSSLYGRQDAEIDPFYLGHDGFVIKTVGDRLVIAGGSASSTVVAVNAFINIYLKNSESFDGSLLSVDKGTLLEVRQSDYPVKYFDIAENDLKDYYINLNGVGKNYRETAELLRDRLYGMTGIYLDIRENDYSSAKRLEMFSFDRVESDRFSATVSRDGTVVFSTGNEKIADYGIICFINQIFSEDKIRVSLGIGTFYSVCVDSVVYSTFGAVGDGVSDDFEAIVKTHEYANRYGLPVSADDNATYYVGSNHNMTAEIKTDTDWGNAKFIIDDSKATKEEAKRWVFTVQSDSSADSVALLPNMKLSKGQSNIGITFDEDKLLYITNAKDIVYLRSGKNKNDGVIMQEIVLVDKDGNIDPSTPIIWDYSAVTSITAYSISDRPITVKGGVFTTYANGLTTGSCYAARGIQVSRSNTTMYGITHYVEGEPESPTDTVGSSASYNGFIHVTYATDVLIESCVFSGHRYYNCSKTPDGVQTLVTQGTYDIVAYYANNVTWKNCSQANSIFDKQ